MFFFFFQAEDGIRDDLVTGVQTCALPISCPPGTVWPGGVPCPWTRETVGRRGMPTGRQGQAAEPTKPAIDQDCRPSVGSGARLVGGGACGWGRVWQYRPARSFHPGHGGRTRLPPRELLAARLSALS